jgi:hypothetical protein
MKKLILGILTIGSLSTQASMLEGNGPLDATLFEAQVNDEKTYFETLGDLFKAGTRPNLLKISNIAWAGRCFSNEAQNDPVNAGYIFRQKRNDAGPIAGTSKAYEAFSYWKPYKAPNYFDKMDIQEVFTTEPNIKARDAKIKTDSIEIILQNDSVKSTLKLSGNYLVEEISGLVTDGASAESVVPGVRCYYFIPDLNN